MTDPAAVAQVWTEAELRIIRRLVARLARGADAPTWELETLARLQEVRAIIVAELTVADAEAAALIEAAISEAYGGGLGQMLADLAPVEHVAPASAQQLRAVRAVVGELSSANTAVPRLMLRAAEDTFRAVVGDVVGSTLARGQSKRAAVQEATTRFLGKGLPSFTDAAGRSWRIADYAAMATRTGVRNAQIRGHEDVLDANHLDLVIIQPGPRACDICDRWARKILTRHGQPGVISTVDLIRGTPMRLRVDDTLAAARAAGFQHPNCRCRLRAYIPGATTKRQIARPPWDAAGYRAQQAQRRLEVRIRDAKLQRAAATTPQAQLEADYRVMGAQASLRAHLGEHPALKRQSAREQVA